MLDFANNLDEIQEAFRPYFADTWTAPTDPNLLYTLQRRILDAGILHPDEVRAGVAAILAKQFFGAAHLNAAIDPALQRYQALDEDTQELVRTAMRDYTRTYALLAQIMPFVDADLEELYYYVKFLLTRISELDPPAGSVDLDGSVILTHLRNELIADQVDGSLTTGTDEALPGMGTAGGKQHTPLEASLSELI